MGGDEFCLLAPWAPGRDPSALVETARAALSERGDGFAVGASCGYAVLPEDGADAAEVLRVADRRLYAEKNSGRISARVQSTGVLRRALDEWDPDLGSHGHDVALMAAGVARRMGLDDDAVDRVAAAAELHDVGKIAIPRTILNKRGPLDAEEWTYMRRHTLIGERIVQAAPALVGVGQLIRSSHERWDGAGYPDGLAGDEIPLGSQIVFICDAFSAMTTDRSYRRGMPEHEALEELSRHAGTQFSPAVVAAFLTEREAAAAPAAVSAGAA
jgi:HD-GYP domain-containing protein (c-di-GMP phosphodiesterase class II)